MDQDLRVIEEIKKNGSDMTALHKVDFALYFPSQEKAEAAEIEINKSYPDFKIEILPHANGHEWLLRANAEIVPELAKMQDIRKNFDDISSKLNGEYDGWGALLVK